MKKWAKAIVRGQDIKVTCPFCEKEIEGLIDEDVGPSWRTAVLISQGNLITIPN